MPGRFLAASPGCTQALRPVRRRGLQCKRGKRTDVCADVSGDGKERDPGGRRQWARREKIIAASGSPVRAEYLERQAFARGHCPGFAQKMAIECRHVDAAPDQVFLDRCIHFRLRFRVAAIPENHCRPGLDGEAPDGFVFVTAKHEQRAAESGKRVVEFFNDSCSHHFCAPPMARPSFGAGS